MNIRSVHLYRRVVAAARRQGVCNAGEDVGRAGIRGRVVGLRAAAARQRRVDPRCVAVFRVLPDHDRVARNCRRAAEIITRIGVGNFEMDLLREGINRPAAKSAPRVWLRLLRSLLQRESMLKPAPVIAEPSFQLCVPTVADAVSLRRDCGLRPRRRFSGRGSHTIRVASPLP